MLSKILLVALLVMLASKLGLRGKLRKLKPRLDRAVNYTIIILVVIYVGQALWWLFKGRAAN